ncbi:putative quinol monooxygenase [Nocardioides donggukensis]|uniref:Antibiotic biosynthesis monooxygenase n=1 Tax=Nocardioides donggukensis TaxID=2774019 RepID=A0A927K7J0_9ACTN|nr:putative quinol monooxygenase [Nocardioides donggukensis]MBD8870443.1 antibiotic biosynthesis monooxygenase [Nocardioides donggukensis]
MIFICVKWKVKPEHADQWIELTRDFTEATRAEEGNLFFDWSRSVEDPNQYVLIEAFRDDAAEAHVTSDHFKRAQAELPAYVQETPLVRNVLMEGDHWDRLGEFEIPQA